MRKSKPITVNGVKYCQEECFGFAMSGEAWRAMALWDAAGHMAGYPDLVPTNGLYCVRVRMRVD